MFTIAKTTKDAFNREYTCDGNNVDCIFNVGADITSAYTQEKDPQSIAYKRLQAIKSTTLTIKNTSGATIAVWPVLSFAPATVIARIPDGAEAKIVEPTYMTKIYLVEDSLMQRAALETKNGPDAFENKLKELEPTRTYWTVSVREPDMLLPDLTSDDIKKKKATYRIDALASNNNGKLDFSVRAFNLETPR
jgi:hypothetical protein